MIVSHLLLILHKKIVLYIYVWRMKCGKRSPNTFARHCIFTIKQNWSSTWHWGAAYPQSLRNASQHSFRHWEQDAAFLVLAPLVTFSHSVNSSPSFRSSRNWPRTTKAAVILNEEIWLCCSGPVLTAGQWCGATVHGGRSKQSWSWALTVVLFFLFLPSTNTWLAN